MTRAEALRRSRIVRVQMPRVCRGFTTETRPGRFVIALNVRNSAFEDQLTLEHELAHIRLGHLGISASVRDCEAEADQAARYILGIGR